MEMNWHNFEIFDILDVERPDFDFLICDFPELHWFFSFRIFPGIHLLPARMDSIEVSTEGGRESGNLIILSLIHESLLFRFNSFFNSWLNQL